MCAVLASGCADAGLLQLDTGGDATGNATGGGSTSVADDSQGDTASDSGDSDPVAGCWPRPTPQALFHVAPDGIDAPGGGSTEAPWASIAFAVASVPDGAVIEVDPGEYVGTQTLQGHFATGVTVRAEPPYLARLRSNGPALTFPNASGITVEGFDIAHDGPGAAPYVVHISDEVGDVGGPDTSQRIVLRDNIIHDSFNNDLLKIDSGTTDIEVTGNVLYNQGGSDEQIDINAASGVQIAGNILFNDFAASGRQSTAETSSFLIVKDADGDADGIAGASDIVIDGNVFMSWQGDAGSNFVLLAERGNPTYGARGVTVQNNLMLGNGVDPMRAPFGIKGATDIAFRSNTVAGDFPANAFAFRFNVEGSSPPNDGIEVYNNIWSDPTATMDDLTDTELSQALEGFVLDTNVYYNGGDPIPQDTTDAVNSASDPNAITGDPALPTSAVDNPTWDPETMRFGGGATSICEAFEALVADHGTPAAAGVGVGAGRADQMPERDILGRARITNDVGAVTLE